MIIDFLERGTSVNSQRYVQTLQKLRARLRKNAIIQHDNARPHTSRETNAPLQKMDFTNVLPHPPDSPDLAPCDFWLFPKLKEHLKGTRFVSDEQVTHAVHSWCRQQPASFFCDGLQQLVYRWRKCITASGDYIEK